MKIILFGATGMVGQGVLYEGLRDSEVESILVVGRSSIPQKHEKLHELIMKNLSDLSAVETELKGYHACLFCLGVSSAGMKEQEYTRLTYDLTMSIAQTLAKLNPALTFIYVSGTGTDSTERGRTMWARVKGKTENALLQLPFKAAYMLRPAYIQPMHGIAAKTTWYRLFYKIMSPLFPLWKLLIPSLVTTSEQVGRAMLEVAQYGASKAVLENTDINKIQRTNVLPSRVS